MEEYIAFDSHKRYTWVEHEQATSGKVRQYRIEHALEPSVARFPAVHRARR